MTDPIISAKGLVRHFTIRKAGSSWKKDVVRAVDGVDLAIGQGETVAVVGESGCGKSTLARLLLGLLEPTSGEVCYGSRRLADINDKERRNFCRDVQIVFQNPANALNPRKRVRAILGGPLLLHELADRTSVGAVVEELLDRVGLSPASAFIDRFPHELSGGQRQRVAVARALSLRPRLIVGDEPLSSLDVTVQAQLFDLMRQLQQDTGLSYVLITHDLSVIRGFANRVVVMYLGRIVEQGPVAQVLDSPRHPYTQALLGATLVADPRESRRRRRRFVIGGDPSNSVAIPAGCRFHPRCPVVMEQCKNVEPALEPAGRGMTATACHRARSDFVALAEPKVKEPVPGGRRGDG